MSNIVESLYRIGGVILNESKSSYKVRIKLPKNASITIEVRRPGGPDPAMRGVDYRHIFIDDYLELPLNVALCDGDLMHYARNKLKSYFTKFIKENYERAKFAYLDFDIKDCHVIDIDGKEYDIKSFIDLHKDFIEGTELKPTKLSDDFWDTFAKWNGHFYETEMFGGEPESGRIYVRKKDLALFEKWFTEHHVTYNITELSNSKYINEHYWNCSISLPKSAFISK